MATNYYVLDENLKRAMVQVVNQHLASFQPRPRQRRRARRGGSSSTPENFRLVRGQSVGVQSGSIITIDNIWVLAGGLDPTDGNPASPLSVANATGNTYADNEIVVAVYSPGVRTSPPADWEVLDALMSSDDIRGYSTTTIPAATGSRDGPVTPGVGAVKLCIPPSGPAGAAWSVQAGTVTAENWMRGSITAYKPILLRKSRLTDTSEQIYTIVSEGCATIPSG